MVGFPPIPILNAKVSANAKAGLWQLAQLTDESLDKSLSEKSFLPSAAFVVTDKDISSMPALSKSIKANNTAMENNKRFIDPKIQKAILSC